MISNVFPLRVAPTLVGLFKGGGNHGACPLLFGGLAASCSRGPSVLHSFGLLYDCWESSVIGTLIASHKARVPVHFLLIRRGQRKNLRKQSNWRCRRQLLWKGKTAYQHACMPCMQKGWRRICRSMINTMMHTMMTSGSHQ